MSCSKYKRFQSKNSKMCMMVKSLTTENTLLKKILVELSQQNVRQKKLMEMLESCQHLTAKDETMASSSGEQIEKEDKSVETVSKMRKQLLLRDGRSTHPRQEACSDEEASANTVAELQRRHSEAMEKNKQWLEYDQQREAYVKAILARMLGLEMRLNETNQRQHNEDYSDEKEQFKLMQEYHERLLQDAQEKLEDLRELIEMTQQTLTVTLHWCEEREIGMEELQQQLQSEKLDRNDADEHCSEGEEQQLSEQIKDLEVVRVDEKKRKSNADLQVNICQKFSLTCPHADKKKTLDMEQQTEQQGGSSLAARHRPSCSNSVLDGSFLKCPCCQTKYPATHYQDLVDHLDDCLK